MKVKLKVGKILYYKNGWGLFGCKPMENDHGLELNNQHGTFTIKGNTIELLEDEVYTFELGAIERNSKGDTYPILQMYMDKVTSSKSQYLFLSNIMSKKQFDSLVEVYPKEKKYKVLDMIKSGEIDLTTIKGIKEKTATKILNEIYENEDKLQVINRLSPLGVSSTIIDKIIDHFGSAHNVIVKLNQSFYNLCQVKGLGFTKVDTYALNDGEDKEGFKRIEACINYLVHEYAGEGHSWTHIDDILVEAVKLLKIDEQHIKAFLLTLDMSSHTSIMNINNEQVTSKYYYNQEKSVLEHLQRLNKSYQFKQANVNLNTYIEKAESQLGITYTEEQRETIIESFNHGVFIINGKGGTGKSTIMKGITTICENLNLEYIAMALSGRAAQLLMNKGIHASTIHRALGYMGKQFLHNESQKLPYDVIIVEESSMVNAQLWDSIVCAIKDGAKIIIVGDSGQLSGIGNGDVLRDLLQTQYFEGKELLQIHRQAQDSGIIEVANKIREGEQITGYNYSLNQSHGVNNDLFTFTYNDKQVLVESAKKVIASQMKKLDKDSILDFQILVSNRNRGELSAVSINKYCQSIYNNFSKRHLKTSVYTFIVDDKVINTGNKYKVHVYQSINDFHLNNPVLDVDGEPKEFSLYNGTIGTIVDVSTTNGHESVLVEFEGIEGYVKLEKEHLTTLDLAYAITIHKSQGMTIKNTLVLIDFGAYSLLSKQLIYTAITRASQKCVVMAENNALFKAVGIDASGSRRTFLRNLILVNK